MGSASRQSQAQRFLDEFKDEYDAKVEQPLGPWEVTAQGIGMSDDGEIRHFVSLKCGQIEIDEVDTGLISIDVNNPHHGGVDVLEHVVAVLGITESTAKQRLIECGMFDESDF